MNILHFIHWDSLAADAYCLLDVYRFLSERLQSSDYLRTFRGEKQIPTLPTTDSPPTTS